MTPDELREEKRLEMARDAKHETAMLEDDDYFSEKADIQSGLTMALEAFKKLCDSYDRDFHREVAYVMEGI